MQRSSRASRVHLSSSSNSSIEEREQEYLYLPTYDPLSQAAIREQSRLRSAQNAIHLIPFVLFLCAIVLWFFSYRELKS